MQCPSCGGQIPDGSRFCLQCGKPTSGGYSAYSPPPPQPAYAAPPAYASVPMTPDEAKRLAAQMKSYVGPAVLVFFLYWIFWLPGFIVNWVFYREAKEMQRIAGQGLPGTGCLAVMLCLNLLGIALMCFTCLTCCLLLIGVSQGLV